MALKLANLAVSKLAASITEGATTLSIQNGDTGKFPILAEGDWHPATIIDQAGNHEIVMVTARAGTTLTVTRAQEGTTAKAFAAGSRIDIRLTSATVLAIVQKINDDVATLNTAIDQRILRAGDTMAAKLTAPALAIDGADNQDQVLEFKKGGKSRFSAFVDTLGRFIIGKYQDNGSWNGNVLSVDRATGIVSFSEKLTAFNGIDLRGTLDIPELSGNIGHNQIKSGTGDGASYTTHNFILKGWWGMGMQTYDGTINGFYDFRSGTWDVKGAFKVDGNVVPHGGFKASVAEIAEGTENKFPDAAAIKAALATVTSLGLGQRWYASSEIGGRSANTIYQNTTGRAIAVYIRVSNSGAPQVSADGTNWKQFGYDDYSQCTLIVPPNHYYRLAGGSAVAWNEMR